MNGTQPDQAAPDRGPAAQSMPEPATARPMPTGPDDIEWEPSYDRATVERFIADVDAERARLHGEIAAARERVAQAQASKRAGDVQSKLSDLVAAARRELEEIEREHQETLRSLSAMAADEAARLLAVAGQEAERERAVAGWIASWPGEGAPPPFIIATEISDDHPANQPAP